MVKKHYVYANISIASRIFISLATVCHTKILQTLTCQHWKRF